MFALFLLLATAQMKPPDTIKPPVYDPQEDKGGIVFPVFDPQEDKTAVRPASEPVQVVLTVRTTNDVTTPPESLAILWGNRFGYGTLLACAFVGGMVVIRLTQQCRKEGYAGR